MTDSIFAGLEPEPRQREWVRIAVIFAVLVILVLIPLLRWQQHEAHRPSLVEIRVVAATQSDPVFREGPRTVSSDERVTLAIALRLDYPNEGSRWLSPVDQLELDGAPIDHIVAESWPEPDRTARTFWFTLESPYLGGVVNEEDAADKMTPRPFLAPELGHSWLADGEPESHADDDINLGNSLVPVEAGTYRVYARVEVVVNEGSSRPLFAATSLGSADLQDPSLVRISRGLGTSFVGFDPAAGHLFRLPGFEAASGSNWNSNEACSDLIVASSMSFAAVALTGSCSGESLEFESLGQLLVTDMGVSSSLRWQDDVLPGDILKQGEHWMVIVSDNGNGILDGQDLVAQSWRRPPAVLPLASAVDEEPKGVKVLRATFR